RRRVTVPASGDGSEGAFEVVHSGDTVHLDLGGRSTAFRLAPPPDVDDPARAAPTHATAGTSGPAQAVRPMPGSVLRLHPARDPTVRTGDRIVTLEAMKMERVVVSPIDGRVADLLVRPADQVTRGQPLAIVEP